jgi:prepilin-type N-terminal cleavage/methylation domain-containing protein
MLKKYTARRGFTLIELLVVIAIIGILAGMIFPALSGARDQAKVTKAKGTLQQLEIALVTYFTEHGTYPPVYGYLSKQAFDDRLSTDQRRGLDTHVDPVDGVTPRTLAPTLDTPYFVTESYMDALGISHDSGFYDPFGDGSDTDYDGVTGLLEYIAPIGGAQNLTVSQYSAARVSGDRPMVYIPVNMRQYNKVKQFWDGNGGYPELRNDVLANMDFPPAKYDAFAIVSVGLVNNTFGLIYDIGEDTNFSQLDKDDYNTNYYYHVAALASFYMLNRNIDADAPDNDINLDFDYDARKSAGQEVFVYPYAIRTDLNGNSITKQIGLGADGPIYRISP